MAIQTPFHVERLRLPCQRHLVDAPVTGFASHSFMYVDAVIEVDEIRYVVDPNPQDRPVVTKARSNRLEHRAVRPYLFVAVHARLCRRDSGKSGLFNGGVAIPAVYADAGHVVFVAEGHRLFSHDILLSYIRRPDDTAPCPYRDHHQEHAAEDREARNCVRAAVEDLSHGWDKATCIPLWGAFGTAWDKITL